MQKMVHSLTMLLVLYHTLVGCCWHHAHAAVPSDRAVAEVNATCCGHSHSDHHGSQESGDHSHRDGNGCEQARCVFLIPAADTGWDVFSSGGHSGVPCAELPHHNVLASNAATSESPPPSGLPPLRLHLVNRILLV